MIFLWESEFTNPKVHAWTKNTEIEVTSIYYKINVYTIDPRL